MRNCLLNYNFFSLFFKGEIFEKDLVVTQNLINYASGTTSEKREFHENTFKWVKQGDSVKIPYTINSELGEFNCSNN